MDISKHDGWTCSNCGKTNIPETRNGCPQCYHNRASQPGSNWIMVVTAGPLLHVGTFFALPNPNVVIRLIGDKYSLETNGNSLDNQWGWMKLSYDGSNLVVDSKSSESIVLRNRKPVPLKAVLQPDDVLKIGRWYFRLASIR